jgi:ankyrin repeat protein
MQDGFTPLFIAAARGYKDVVEQLLGAGAAMEAATKVIRPPTV